MQFGYFFHYKEPEAGDVIFVVDVTKMEQQYDGAYTLEATSNYPSSRCVITDMFQETGSQGLMMVRCEPVRDVEPTDPSQKAERNDLATQCKQVLDAFIERYAHNFSSMEADFKPPPGLGTSDRAAEYVYCYTTVLPSFLICDVSLSLS